MAAERLRQAQQALERLPSSCGVRLADEGEAGLALRAARALPAGALLLELPFASCVTSRDLGDHPLDQLLPQDDSFGRLVAALLLLPEADPRGVYLEQVVPTGHFEESMMAAWEDSEIEELLENSLSWQRARRLRGEAQREAMALRKAGHAVAGGWRRYLHLKLLATTRAVRVGGEEGGGGDRHVLAPIVDLANHRSRGNSARLRGTEDALQMVALEDLEEGEEVSICYDPAADYLDLFERYGFFDESNGIRTVEVPAQLEDWEECEGWGQGPLEAAKSRGFDEEIGSFWLPEVQPDRGPLMAAVRATLATREEVSGDDELLSPIAAEAEAKSRVASLLQDHLKAFATTAMQDAEALQKPSGLAARPQGRAALRLLLFEKGLLSAELKRLRA